MEIYIVTCYENDNPGYSILGAYSTMDKAYQCAYDYGYLYCGMTEPEDKVEGLWMAVLFYPELTINIDRISLDDERIPLDDEP